MERIIEGVPNSKLERLKKHLLWIEEQTGGKLRGVPRQDYEECPIFNFAPDKNGEGKEFLDAGMQLYYGGFNSSEIYPSVYKKADWLWWENLTKERRLRITEYIQNWIKNGRKD
jgi:hypothetical protein